MSVAARPAAQLLRQRRGIVHLLVIIQLRGFLPALAVPVASGGGVEPLPASGPARPRAALRRKGACVYPAAEVPRLRLRCAGASFGAHDGDIAKSGEIVTGSGGIVSTVGCMCRCRLHVPLSVA